MTGGIKPKWINYSRYNANLKCPAAVARNSHLIFNVIEFQVGKAIRVDLIRGGLSGRFSKKASSSKFIYHSFSFIKVLRIFSIFFQISY